jgi:hypothetical protein
MELAPMAATTSLLGDIELPLKKGGEGRNQEGDGMF